MKIQFDWGWPTFLSVLMLVPSLAIGQVDPGDPDPGLTAFGAGDFKKAYDLWQLEATLGDPNSQYYLGYLYESGQGVKVDHGKSFYWYNESSKNECRAAQCNLATLYMTGRGVTLNHDEAIRHFVNCVSPGGTCREQIVRMRELVEERLTWYSDQGYADAQYELAYVALDRGDFATSAAWLQKAAEREHGPAQVALADAYLNGMGIDQDVERGAQLLFQAMVQHRENAAVLSSAKHTLAMAYRNGNIKTTKPAISTYVWARLALEDYPDKNSIAGMMYDKIENDAVLAMTESELMNAFRLASRWSELVAAGLPGVSVENLRTLRLPQ